MKKIFLTALSLVIAAYSAQSFAEQASINKPFSLIEKDSRWLDHLSFYKSWPIKFYNNLPETESSQNTLQTIPTREYPYDTAVSADRGQRMFDSETYSVQKNSYEGAYSASEDGILYTINKEVYLTKDEPLYPIGEVKIADEYCLLFEPEHDRSIILVDQQGHILPANGYIYKNELVLSKEQTQISPHNLVITPITEGEEFTTNPQMEFEIIYNGTENNVMSFTYVDHRDQAVGRNSKQRFAFPTTQNLININGIKFRVLYADENRIEYMIIK